MYIADKEKNSVDYKMLSFKVADINFYYRHGTLYDYLDHSLRSDAVEIFKVDKLFLEDLLLLYYYYYWQIFIEGEFLSRNTIYKITYNIYTVVLETLQNLKLKLS